MTAAASLHLIPPCRWHGDCSAASTTRQVSRARSASGAIARWRRDPLALQFAPDARDRGAHDDAGGLVDDGQTVFDRVDLGEEVGHRPGYGPPASSCRQTIRPRESAASAGGAWCMKGGPKWFCMGNGTGHQAAAAVDFLVAMRVCRGTAILAVSPGRGENLTLDTQCRGRLSTPQRTFASAESSRTCGRHGLLTGPLVFWPKKWAKFGAPY